MFESLQRTTGSLIAKNRAPFARKQTRVVITIKQPIDQIFSFVFATVVGECLSFLKRRQAAGNIQSDAAEIRRIVTLGRGRNAE